MAEQSYRTSGRTGILSFLKASENRPVSVSEIKDYMDSAGMPVNVTTIYRYLEKLTEDGRLIRYAAGKDGKSSYQYVEEGNKCDSHLHLRCTNCGSVEHLDCRFMDEITSHILQEHGFALECRNSVIYGFCQRCRRRKDAAESCENRK